MSVRQSSLNVYARHNPPELAEYLALQPMINSGVFSAPRLSPVWAAWAGKMESSIGALGESFLAGSEETRHHDFLVEQAALNTVVYAGGLKVNFLPSVYNWTAHMSLPAYDQKLGLMCEPQWPHAPVKILHMVAGTKRKAYDLQDISDRESAEDKTVRRSLMSPFKAGIF
jgi:hypothetical protein